MWQIKFENQIFEVLLPDWEAFLFSDEIYWPIQIRGKNVPAIYRSVRLSAGRLLFAEKLLSGDTYEDELLKINVQNNLDKFFRLRNRWKANWVRKTLSELPVRVRQWQRLVQEIHQDSNYSIHQLANDIQVRLMIDLLLRQSENENRDEFLQLLEISDYKFKSLTYENSFIWNDDLSTIFDKDQNWYLYRNITNPGGLK